MHSCCISSDVCECFKFTVSIFILKYMHAYFQIVFIAAVYCLFFFVPMYMHICTFRIRRLLLARTWYLMSYASPTRHKLSSLFFCSHRVKYTCSNILDTINIIIITHLKTKLKRKENGKENGKEMTYTHIYTYT